MLKCGVSLLLGLCVVAPVKAGCSFKSGSTLGVATITLPANLSIPADVVVGTVLWDSGMIATNSSSISCSGTGATTRGYLTAMTPVPGTTSVYSSGVSGIGIKVLFAGGMGSTPGSSVDWPAFTGGYNGYPYGPMGQFQVQLIATGRVSAGSFNLPTPLAQMMYGDLQVSILNLANNTAHVVAPACTVQNASIAVDLPTVNFSGLPAVGATAGDKAFSIVLNCPATVSVAMTFTDAATPDNRSNVLSLNKSSSAAGVGYQIVYNTVPVSYGPDSSVAANVNQVSLGVVSTGGMTIPLVARYVRTGKITPGSANANATFTMSYQ